MLTEKQQPPLPPEPYDSAPARAPKRRWRWPVVMAIVAAIALAVGGGAYLVVNLVHGLSAEFKSVGDNILGKASHGAYSGIWDETALELRQTVFRPDMVGMFEAVEAKVGKPVSWKVTGFHKEAQAAPGGTKSLTTITYQVTHERGASTATITVDQDQRLLGINFDWQ